MSWLPREIPRKPSVFEQIAPTWISMNKKKNGKYLSGWWDIGWSLNEQDPTAPSITEKINAMGDLTVSKKGTMDQSALCDKKGYSIECRRRSSGFEKT